MINFKRVLFTLSVLLFASSLYASIAQLAFNTSQKNYILLIDSSKSMHYFDPKGLRESTARLFSILAPKGAYAGVYQFSSQVSPLIPFQKVTQEFRKELSKKSGEIYSEGVSSDLNDALLFAKAKLEQVEGEKHIILVTDGFLDSGRSNRVSHKLEKQIEQQIIPALSKSQIHVHAIINESTANKKLLDELTEKTNGILQQVQYPDQMTKKLIYIFDRTTHEAYQNNQKSKTFEVSHNTKEVAVIINEPDVNVVLVDPEGSPYRESEAPDHIKWSRDYGYQFITIEKPLSGVWQLKSNHALDNRVIIFDDFQVEVSDIPHHLFLREHLLLNVALMMKGEIVHNESILKYLHFKVIEKHEHDQERIFELSSPKKNGIYHGNIVLDKTGKHELQIMISSPAFKRIVSRTIFVYPSPIQVKNLRDYRDKKHIIQILPSSKILIPKKTQVTAVVKYESQQIVQKLKYNEDISCWQLELKELPAGKAYSLYFKVEGVDEMGRHFHILTDSELLYGDLQVNVDMSKITPSQLPRHIPLIYRFDLIQYDYLKKLGYPDIQFETKSAQQSSQQELEALKEETGPEGFVKFEEIEVKNPVFDLLLSAMTMIFLVILLFLYIRGKSLRKRAVLGKLYELLSNDDRYSKGHM